MAEEKMNEVTVNGKGGKIAIAVLIVVVVVLVGVVLYLVFGREPETIADPIAPSSGTVVTDDNVDEILDSMDESEFVAPGSYNVTMNNTWTFPDGNSASSDAYVKNSEVNTSAVRFEIFLEEDESNILYSSPTLPVGSHLEDITLDKDLDAGTYDCVIKYILQDDEGNDTSYVRVGMTIVVEE